MAAQKFMYREHDIMQQVEMKVYMEVWKEHEQLQVWYHQEAGTMADERSELAAQNARLDSAANQIAQRDFDAQIVSDAVEKHLRRQFEDELSHAHSQAQMSLHACNSIKL